MARWRCSCAPIPSLPRSLSELGDGHRKPTSCSRLTARPSSLCSSPRRVPSSRRGSATGSMSAGGRGRGGRPRSRRPIAPTFPVDIVVDDHVLLDVLAGIESPALHEERGGGVLFTTGSWYYRLSRAVNAWYGERIAVRPTRRVLSSQRDRALAALQALPATIGLLSYRTLVPVMTALRVRRPLNMLNAEALSVSCFLSSTAPSGSGSRRHCSVMVRRDLEVDYRVPAQRDG